MTTELVCPYCKETVEVSEKKWGEESPPCPHCRTVVPWWLQGGEYNVDFVVAGGTGAQRQGRKKFGGHKT